MSQRTPLSSRIGRVGRFYEDFRLDEVIRHPCPRTITDGDVALYTALYPQRYAVYSSHVFARAIGFTGTPVDGLLVFHIVFGKSVGEISRNAVANLGYADGRFTRPVYVGDTLAVTSEVIGLSENRNGKTGIVYVRTTGKNQRDEEVLSYVRWVMVTKRAPGPPRTAPVVPTLPDVVEDIPAGCPPLAREHYDTALTGSCDLYDAYRIGDKIDHVDGMTVEEAEHQLATRLFQNTARVHFDQFTAASGRFGRRLIYGGHVISLARGLSANGLENAFFIAAINAGTHVGPFFSGETLFAWSEILDKRPISGREDVGALRLRLVATRDCPCTDMPLRDKSGEYAGEVILAFDYWALIVR